MDTDGDGSFDEAEFTRACVKVYTPAVDAAHVEANPEAEDAKEDIIEAKESADRAAAATKAAAARANEEARAKSFAQATRGLGGGGLVGTSLCEHCTYLTVPYISWFMLLQLVCVYALQSFHVNTWWRFI